MSEITFLMKIEMRDLLATKEKLYLFTYLLIFTLTEFFAQLK